MQIMSEHILHSAERFPGVYDATELASAPAQRLHRLESSGWLCGYKAWSDELGLFVSAGRHYLDEQEFTDRPAYDLDRLLGGHDMGRAQDIVGVVGWECNLILGHKIDNKKDHPDISEDLKSLNRRLRHIGGLPEVSVADRRKVQKKQLYRNLDRLSARLDMERRLRIARLGAYLVERERAGGRLWVSPNGWSSGNPVLAAPIVGLAVQTVAPHHAIDRAAHSEISDPAATPVILGKDGERYVLKRSQGSPSYHLYAWQKGYQGRSKSGDPVTRIRKHDATRYKELVSGARRRQYWATQDN